MTMTDQQAAELEARIAALEARFGVAVPLAAAPVTVGDLTNVPQPLAPITSLWAQQSTARTMGRYATPTARTNAWNASAQPLAKGTGSYLSTAAETEGPEWYDGTAWRKPWNMPWGLQARGISTFAGGGLQPMQDVVVTPSFPTLTGRRLKVSCLINVTNGGAQGQITQQITDGANSAVQQAGYTVPANFSVVLFTFYEINAGTGNAVFKGRCGSNAPFALAGSTSQISYILVEDVGPVVGSPPI